MINNLRDLLLALNDTRDLRPQRKKKDFPVRVYLNGRYMIEQVRLSEYDGAIVLWLHERGDQ